MYSLRPGVIVDEMIELKVAEQTFSSKYVKFLLVLREVGIAQCLEAVATLWTTTRTTRLLYVILLEIYLSLLLCEYIS